MKKTKIFTALILSVLIFASCTVKPDESTGANLKIVTTVFPLYDFIAKLCGDKADVTMLLPVGAEAHSYEPTLKDVVKIKESDLFINIGGSADEWADDIIESTEGKELNVLSVSEHLELIQENHEHSHENSTFDEHVWTSPKNAIKIAEMIASELCRISPENEEYFKENEKKLLKELTILDDGFTKAIQNASRKTLIFADSFPFRYFTRDYSLDYLAAFPGCSAESEPSVLTVKNLVEKIKSEKIPVVFYTETSNQKMPDAICEETGAEKMLMHSCHTVTKEQLKNKVSYVDLMQDNLRALTEALK